MNETTAAPLPQNDIIETLVNSAQRLAQIAGQLAVPSTSAAVAHTLSTLDTEGPLRLEGLADATGIETGALSRILADLVEQELVHRVADVEDRRDWLILIGPKGHRALTAHSHQLGTALAPLFDDLTDDDRATLERASQLLEQRVDQNSDLGMIAA